MGETANDSAPRGDRAKRWAVRGVLGLGGFVLLWLIGDMMHAAYIACAIDAWKDSVEQTDQGVIAGCEAFDLPPADGAEPLGAVLLVHGFNASPRHWELVAPELAESGLHVRAMRLPRFAEPFSLSSDRDPDEWVEAVAGELAALRDKHERVGVVGHSLGGAVTIRALIDDPDAADWAVLVAPAVAVSSARSPVLSTRTWHEVSQRVLLSTNVVKSPFPMDCRVEGRTDWPGRMPFSSAQIVDALFELLDRNAPDAEQFTTPVTMLVAKEDRIVDTPAATAYFERLGSSDKNLVVLDDSGHEVPLDKQRGKLVEVIVGSRQ